jgi:hypothetical protein
MFNQTLSEKLERAGNEVIGKLVAIVGLFALTKLNEVPVEL